MSISFPRALGSSSFRTPSIVMAPIASRIGQITSGLAARSSATSSTRREVLCETWVLPTTRFRFTGGTRRRAPSMIRTSPPMVET